MWSCNCHERYWSTGGNLPTPTYSTFTAILFCSVPLFYFFLLFLILYKQLLSCEALRFASCGVRSAIYMTLSSFCPLCCSIPQCSLPCPQVLNKLEEFEEAVRKTVKDVRLDNDVVVSVFETNIRVLGWGPRLLLSSLSISSLSSSPSTYPTTKLPNSILLGFRSRVKMYDRYALRLIVYFKG